ncbi:MAG: 3-methyl-2-oxobutanoate hydroxymethyltransferase [Pseudomonadota bacterium]
MNNNSNNSTLPNTVKNTAPVTLSSLQKQKALKEKTTCLTAYDASFARVAGEAGVDLLLIGDSLGMVLQGNTSTLPVSIEHMVYHTECVARGRVRSMIMSDLPFLSTVSEIQCLDWAGKLMQAGAEIVKLEGGQWATSYVEQLKRCGIPVCVHLGLTPQYVHQFGGYKVQGKKLDAAQRLIEDAQVLENSGADMLLLECIPISVTEKIMNAVHIPVIGIGAGKLTDGQILVMHDLLGVSPPPHARFVENFLTNQNSIHAAIAAYVDAVRNQTYPTDAQSFH